MIETLPADELPAGIPAPHAPVQPARNKQGHYIAGLASTREAASRAGKARKHHTALAHKLNVTSADPAWQAYQRQAEAFRRSQTSLLAQTVGGGICGPAPASLVGCAALALAGSRFAYSQGDLTLGSRLAAEARQHLLGAHELCAREAKARPAAQLPWDGDDDSSDDSAPDDDGSDAANGQPGAAIGMAEGDE